MKNEKLSKNGYGIMNIYGKENLSVVSTSQNVQKLKQAEIQVLNL